jgi:hypothetical protein
MFKKKYRFNLMVKAAEEFKLYTFGGSQPFSYALVQSAMAFLELVMCPFFGSQIRVSPVR